MPDIRYYCIHLSSSFAPAQTERQPYVDRIFSSFLLLLLFLLSLARIHSRSANNIPPDGRHSAASIHSAFHTASNTRTMDSVGASFTFDRDTRGLAPTVIKRTDSMVRQVQPLRISKGVTPSSSPNKAMARPLSEIGGTSQRRNSPSYNQATKVHPSDASSPRPPVRTDLPL